MPLANPPSISLPDRRRWWLGCLLVLIGLAAYLPTLRNGFVRDDDTFLTKNALIKASDGLWRFWFSTKPPDYWPVMGFTDVYFMRYALVADHYQHLAINPDKAEAHYNLGLVLAREGRRTEATAEDATALRLRPAFPDAQNTLGDGLLRAGRPAEAVPGFE